MRRTRSCPFLVLGMCMSSDMKVISMCDLVQKVCELIQSHDLDPGKSAVYETLPEKMTKNFNQEDLQTGKRAAEKFNKLVTISDDQVKKANWITQFFLFFRSLFQGDSISNPIYHFPDY